VTSLAELCLDMFLLGHAHLADDEVGDGFGFERRIRGHLDRQGLRSAAGFRVFGPRGVSGLYHQIDEQTSCDQALVVGEWKTYTGAIPKNELLRFKAATDDYWMAATTTLPVVRIFGGTGTISPAMQTYAAHWGIVLISLDRWPIPTLCDPHLLWDPAELEPPPPADQRVLASLIRPLNAVLQPTVDGGWRIPPMPADTDVAARRRLWAEWSDRAWAWWDDSSPARFSTLLSHRVETPGAAA
jgi:hypothetical protein